MPGRLFIKISASFILAVLLSAASQAQDCRPPLLTNDNKAYNIFSPDQEMVLGDLTYQRLAGDMHFVKDEELVRYLTRIGEKLIKHLPPTGLKFQFFIVDIPEANAFNVPGGYVFFSRKLIGFARTEDELAGVMAHELGHALVRHGATTFSEQLKKILNVTQVGDRKDIAEKYNLLIERRRTRQFSRSNEDEHQIEADRVALFALIAAGYDPNGFAEFFSRLVETKAKGGNWFSDIFGKRTPEEKRLREMIKVSQEMPEKCRERHATNASQEFLTWQADVVSYHDKNQKEELPGLLWKRELSPKLSSDISHFSFSPDATHFLAQDDFVITVIQREPLRVLFQIPAPDAHEANFTPDGQSVVFGTENLRYEKWSLAEQKPVQMRELVNRRDCWEHGFSPDGKYLVCFDYGLALNVLETETGKKVFEKKEFYRLTSLEYFSWVWASEDDSSRDKFFHIQFSPDCKILALARSNKFRFKFTVDYLTADATEDTLLALDLPTMKPISTGGELKKVTKRPFVFLDSSRVLGMAAEKIDDSGIFSFPEGKRLTRIKFGADELKRTGNPNYVVIKPLANAKMGIYDLTKGEVVSGSNKVDADLWRNLIIYESASGQILLSEVKYDEKTKVLQPTALAKIDIPVGSVGELYAAHFSDNLQWLAISTKTRGALWNLSSGERKLFVRGFRGAFLANDGGAIGDFPKQEPLEHSLALLNPVTQDVHVFRQIPEVGARQYGSFLLIRRSLKEPKKAEEKKEKEDRRAPIDPEQENTLRREVHFELRNIITDKVVWSRDFPKEAPGFFFDEFSGRLILHWTLGSDVGKARLKEDPILAARAKELDNKDDDYLLEVVDAFAGKPVGTLLLETGKGSFYFTFGFSAGDLVVLHDSENRVLVYSIKDGTLLQRFFGSDSAVNIGRNLIVVENYPGELTCYNLITGDIEARLTFGTETSFSRFSSDGKKLFVLTGNQIAYAFDVDKLPNKATAQTH